jgi:hypothetical protein
MHLIPEIKIVRGQLVYQPRTIPVAITDPGADVCIIRIQGAGSQ